MYLRAHGDYLQTIDSELPELKDLVTDAIGQPIRRISRFMQLALIGAGRCARNQSMPKGTAVYLASSRGDLEITIDVMNHVFREGQSPKPLSFVNTVSNSAAFYVAKCLGLDSRSSFVCSRYFAFEDAVQLALIDFQMNNASSALIGCVDSVVLPLHAHRTRLELSTDTPVAEVSHWLWFTKDSSADVQIVDAAMLPNRKSLLEWIEKQKLITSETSISTGQFLNDNDFVQLQRDTSIQSTFHYRNNRANYHSQSAACISEFLTASLPQSHLLHINSDPLGRYCVMLIRRE